MARRPAHGCAPVQARQLAQARARARKIHGQHRFHLRRAKGARALPAVAGQLSRGVPGRHGGRAPLVGDVGPHAPEHWEGGLGGPDIHAMAWIRTDSDQGREEAMRILRAEMEAAGGVEIRFVQDTMALAQRTGSGPRASTSATWIRSRSRRSRARTLPAHPGDGVPEDGTWRPLKPGEFLLGYEDEVGPHGTQAPEPRELRLNGTYLVFRKLHQDVAAFRRPGDGREVALRGRRRLPPGTGGGQDDGSLAQWVPAGSVAR